MYTVIRVALALLLSPILLHAQSAPARAAIDSTLDALHSAASTPDGSRYFSLFTSDAIYIGTDASERWTIRQFRDFAEPYFSKGRGWTYTPRERHIVIADIPCGCVAWFDELLDSESYGTSRGTGVLLKQGSAWKISQYALTFPIPNDLAKGFTDQIKAFESRTRKQTLNNKEN